MRYLSTRGDAPVLSFDEVLLAGLARDGGLYLPETWPQFTPGEIRGLAGRSYAEIAFAVIRPFVAGCIPDGDLRRILAETYAGFEHAAVPPPKPPHDRTWQIELFHRPPSAYNAYPPQTPRTP